MMKRSILGAFAATAFLLSLAAGNASADTKVRFVSPAWVAKHHGAAHVRILDLRKDPHDYFQGHIPGAVHLASASLRGPEGGIPVQYLPLRMMADMLERAGVDKKSTVVLYAEGEDVLDASMTAYVLERIGHRRVMIMNGGWSAYAARYPTTQQYPSYRPGDLRVRNVRSIRATLRSVVRLLASPRVTFVDARPAHAYQGLDNIWMRNGHIPGARSLDWHQLVEPDNPHELKPKAELRSIFASRGLDKHSEIIFYCGTSREASLEYMVAKHVLGFSNVRLYEGSWAEYAARPELPVIKGPAPGSSH